MITQEEKIRNIGLPYLVFDLSLQQDYPGN